MVEDVLDLLILILVLSVCIALGLGQVLPLLNDYRMGYQTELVDKSALKLSGSDQNDAVYDGTISRQEAVLMTQVQDYSMPEPRELSTEGKNIPITSVYKLDVIGYGTQVNQYLIQEAEAQNTRYSDPAMVANPRYVLGYRYVSTTHPEWGDSYAIIRSVVIGCEDPTTEKKYACYESEATPAQLDDWISGVYFKTMQEAVEAGYVPYYAK